VPIGCGTGSALLSTFLGATLTGSVCFILGGAAIGYVIKRCMTNTDPHHDFIFDITNIGSLFQFQDKDESAVDNSVAIPDEETKESEEASSDKTPTTDTSAKTIDDILKGTTPGEKTKGKAKQFKKPGTYETTKKDFYSLNPSNVTIEARPNGEEIILGILPDGRRVNARNGSSYETPTLEIQELSGKRCIKIRYTG